MECNKQEHVGTRVIQVKNKIQNQLVVDIQSEFMGKKEFEWVSKITSVA